MLPLNRLRSNTSFGESNKRNKEPSVPYRSDEAEFIVELVKEKNSIENKMLAIERNIKLKYASLAQVVPKQESEQRVVKLIPLKKVYNPPKILKTDKSFPLINKLIDSHSKIFQLLRQRRENQKYLRYLGNKKLKLLRNSLGAIKIKDTNTKYKNLLTSIEMNKLSPLCHKERVKCRLEKTEPCLKNELTLIHHNDLLS